MPEASRLNDSIEHSLALGGLITGVIAGALIGAATVATGGAALAVIAAACAGASLGGTAGQLLGSLFKIPSGYINMASMTVTIEGKSAARATDLVSCSGAFLFPIPHPGAQIAQGSSNVFIENLPAARKGDKTTCGASIAEGASSVIIGGNQANILKISSEVPWYAETALFVLGLVASGGTIAMAVSGKRLITACQIGGSMIGGFGLGSASNYAGGKIFGEGSTGQTLCALGGGFIGTILGGSIGGKGGQIWQNKKLNIKNVKNKHIECNQQGGDPVNIITGEVIIEHHDFTFPGRIPLDWNRYYSSQDEHMGVCGYGWQTPADSRLTLHKDGMIIFYDGGPGAAIFKSLPDEKPIMEIVDGAVLSEHNSKLKVCTKEGLIYYFQKPKGEFNEILVEKITDQNGNWLKFIRENNELKKIINNLGQCINVTSHDKRIIQMEYMVEENVRPLVRYDYDQDGNLTNVYDAMDNPYQFSYQNHKLLSHTNRNGLSFYYEYDLYSGKCIHSYGDNGLYDYKFEYSDTSTQITNSLGYIKTIHYNDTGFPLKEIDHIGNVTQYEYDNCCRTSAVIDPSGNKTEYEYDDRGNLLKLTRPDNSTIITEFDDNNKPIKIIDPNGNIWKQEWKNDLLHKQISPNESEVNYFYNNNGDLISFTNPKGDVTYYNPDQYGNIISIIDALGNKTHFEVNDLGQIIAEIDPLGVKTIYEYDQKFRLINIIYNSGKKVSCGYDNDDNLIYYRDESGHTTKFEYTGIGELAKRIEPDGSVVKYEYDTEEQLLGVTNERGETFKLLRDHLGRIVEDIDYWGNSRKFTYDQSGNVIYTKDSIGREIHYKYDLLSRLKLKIFSDNKTEIFDYDPNGNLIYHKNGHIQIKRVFDSENQMIKELQGDFEIINHYDLNGNRIQRRSSHGNTIDYTYNALNDVESISINKKQVIQIQRDAIGSPIRENLSDFFQREYKYNKDGLLTHQKTMSPYDTLFDCYYEYDPTGNLLSMTEEKKGKTSFTYDPRGRIIEHINPAGKIKQYLYDPAGDLLKPAQNLKQQNNRILTYEDNHYHFDAAGNLIERNGDKGTTRFEWDENDRLTVANHEDGSQTRMIYDSQGRRISKQTGGLKTYFTWDGDCLLSENIYGKGSREFVFYPDSFVPLAIIDTNKNIYYYQNNVVGLPQKIFNESGRILWSSDFDTFGNSENLNYNGFDNPIRFQGQYFDEELGLCYNRYRYYDPNIGAFISKDPLGLAAGVNLYRYAPNAWRWIDPLGLSCKASKSGPIKANEVTTFQDFRNRSKIGDNLEGHEALQHANLNERGLATTRLSTDASKNNPVIALEKSVHKEVNKVQRNLSPRTQTGTQNISDNIQILRDNPNIPNDVIDQLERMAIEHNSGL